MTKTSVILVALLAFGLALWGCGDNTGGPAGFVGTPKNVKAISLNESTIELFWSPPDGLVDSLFAGYRIQYLGRDQAIPKTSLSYIAGSLPPGDVVFTLSARGSGAQVSDGVAFRWAPAARFDSTLVITEFSSGDLNRSCCIDLGSSLRDPSVTSFNAPNARQLVDLYLWGEPVTAGGPASPLELRSPSFFSTAYNVTLMSSVTSASPSLDFPLSAFPQDFSTQIMPVTDNTIYYVRVPGENATVFYARLHVRVLGGVAPNRTIGVTISLQRTPALPIASSGQERQILIASRVPGDADR
jgi:hypothetical protein